MELGLPVSHGIIEAMEGTIEVTSEPNSGTEFVVRLGHTRCGAVTSSVKLLDERKDTEQASGCPHLHAIVSEIQESVEGDECRGVASMQPNAMDACVDRIAKKSVERTVREIVNRSHAIRSAVDAASYLSSARCTTSRRDAFRFSPMPRCY